MNQDMLLELRKAATKEQEAYDFYLELRKKTLDTALQALFSRLAVEELKHESLLREAMRSGDIDKAKKKMSVQQERLSLSDIRPVDVAELRAGIRTAIKKEHEALKLYLDLYKYSDTAELKDLFRFLATEEARHEQLLKKEYDKL